tara:strand:+ start:883 stop:1359 length:477 start_codon:yes stop_codon:yes gene_type:complete
MNYTTVSKEIQKLAEIEGKRIFDNNQKRDRPLDQIRDNELEINILGVMSELAACEILSKNNRVYRRNQPESNKSVKEPDIIVDDNITVEVKGHPKHVTYWRMNKKAFYDVKKKKADFYWMIKFTTDTDVQYEIFTKEEVSKWETKQLQHSPVLYSNYR